MSEAKETVSGSSDEIRCSGAAGMPRADDFNVQGTAWLQSIVEKIDERMNDLGKQAERSRKNKDYNWENVSNAEFLSALYARRIVLDMLEQITQHEGTKPSS